MISEKTTAAKMAEYMLATKPSEANEHETIFMPLVVGMILAINDRRLATDMIDEVRKTHPRMIRLGLEVTNYWRRINDNG